MQVPGPNGRPPSRSAARGRVPVAPGTSSTRSRSVEAGASPTVLTRHVGADGGRRAGGGSTMIFGLPRTVRPDGARKARRVPARAGHSPAGAGGRRDGRIGPFARADGGNRLRESFPPLIFGFPIHPLSPSQWAALPDAAAVSFPPCARAGEPHEQDGHDPTAPAPGTGAAGAGRGSGGREHERFRLLTFHARSTQPIRAAARCPAAIRETRIAAATPPPPHRLAPFPSVDVSRLVDEVATLPADLLSNRTLS
jgi:hypothetical protein